LAVHGALQQHGIASTRIDGDEVRKTLCSDLGFSLEDRMENVKRISILASESVEAGVVALVSVISPYRRARDEARARVGRFLEVFVNAPLHVCEDRDPKSLYRAARQGRITNFTGIHMPYEPPLRPEITCFTDVETVEESAAKVIAGILEWRSRPAAPLTAR
jgi:adenylylsulfate kinase